MAWLTKSATDGYGLQKPDAVDPYSEIDIALSRLWQYQLRLITDIDQVDEATLCTMTSIATFYATIAHTETRRLARRKARHDFTVANKSLIRLGQKKSTLLEGLAVVHGEIGHLQARLWLAIESSRDESR
jgi:hypothetical protein